MPECAGRMVKPFKARPASQPQHTRLFFMDCGEFIVCYAAGIIRVMLGGDKSMAVVHIETTPCSHPDEADPILENPAYRS
jgi:hypothetical protein